MKLLILLLLSSVCFGQCEDNCSFLYDSLLKKAGVKTVYKYDTVATRYGYDVFKTTTVFGVWSYEDDGTIKKGYTKRERVVIVQKGYAVTDFGQIAGSVTLEIYINREAVEKGIKF